MQTRFVRRPGGPAICVKQLGSGHLTCLLLHGYGDSSEIWEELAEKLAAFCAVVLVDLRGHGDSEWAADGSYRVAECVEDVQHVVDVLACPSFLVIGHSYGGEVATRIVARNAARAKALVLVDAGPDSNPEGIGQMLAYLRESLRLYESVEEYAMWLAARRPLVSAERLRKTAARSLRACEGGFRLKLDPALVNCDDDPEADRETWGLLHRLPCPVLVVRGKASAVFPRSVAARMGRVIPRAQLVTISMAGHAVMADNPADFTRAVMTFLVGIGIGARHRSGEAAR